MPDINWDTLMESLPDMSRAELTTLITRAVAELDDRLAKADRKLREAEAKARAIEAATPVRCDYHSSAMIDMICVLNAGHVGAHRTWTGSAFTV